MTVVNFGKALVNTGLVMLNGKTTSKHGCILDNGDMLSGYAT